MFTPGELGDYLGVPITKGVSHLKHFYGLRSISKLGGWRAKTLSLAGRICLINYSLLPMLYHILAHCRVPKGLLSWLNVQLRAFLWNHSPPERKWHYINWETFTERKESGGAGVLDIYRWYEALTRKHAIQVLAEPNNAWVKYSRTK